MDKDNLPILYILMRTDLASMNPGKAIAQGSHAANAFVFETSQNVNDDVVKLYRQWIKSTKQGFGTAIVLDCKDEQTMMEIVDDAMSKHFAANAIFDPTYPIRDGLVTHLLPIFTCAYVFCTRKESSSILHMSELELYK